MLTESKHRQKTGTTPRGYPKDFKCLRRAAPSPSGKGKGSLLPCASPHLRRYWAETTGHPDDSHIASVRRDSPGPSSHSPCRWSTSLWQALRLDLQVANGRIIAGCAHETTSRSRNDVQLQCEVQEQVVCAAVALGVTLSRAVRLPRLLWRTSSATRARSRSRKGAPRSSHLEYCPTRSSPRRGMPGGLSVGAHGGL